MDLKEMLKTVQFKEEIYTIAEEIVDEIKNYNVSAILNGDIDVEEIQQIILKGLEQLEKETNSF
jgi:thiamine monophosphate synthase